MFSTIDGNKVLGHFYDTTEETACECEDRHYRTDQKRSDATVR
jgi:hypothetical protein